MNNKNRLLARRRESNSREPSYLRSVSKSADCSKGRTDSRLLRRPKTKTNSENSETATTHKKITTQRNPGECSNEYYTYLRGKSKSRGKLQSGEEFTKTSYFNNIYMHKESQQAALPRTLPDRSEQPPSNSILNKIRMIEKNGAIDANGKFVVKESRQKALEAARSMDGMRSIDSQHTISINEELRKDKPKKTHRPKPHKPKPKREEHKLQEAKSTDKFKKKIVSPSILEKHTEQYYEAEVTNNL